MYVPGYLCAEGGGCMGGSEGNPCPQLSSDLIVPWFCL